MDKWFDKKMWGRIGLFLLTTVVMLLVMPRADHQSYSYEVNQPWKYPLLTAEFDLQVLPDSVAAQEIRDSIDVNFVPYAQQIEGVATEKLTKLKTDLNGITHSPSRIFLTSMLGQVYNRGIMDDKLSNYVRKQGKWQIRKIDSSEHAGVKFINAEDMLTLDEAYNYIIESFVANAELPDTLSAKIEDAVAAAISPTVVLDASTDNLYREKEFETISKNYNNIKKGQRIVDRGEIVTPKIYHSLETYLQEVNAREDSGLNKTYFALGRAIVILLVMTCLFLFLWHYRRNYYDSLKKVIFLLSYMTLFVLFSSVIFDYSQNGLSIIPFAAVPVVIMIFFDSRTAIMTLFATVLICSTIATFPFNFIILEMLAGIVATVSITQLTRRSQLLLTALWTFIVYCIGYVGLQFLIEGTAQHIQYKQFGVYAINAVVLSFAYVLIFLVEKIFGLTSNVTLVEMSDFNNDILKRLAREAPGTFQHSVQVSTLASEAAAAIGANTLLVRTGALYHDIGKLENPVFFTENQHGVNPHSELDPETSAQIIISHIQSGMKMAKHHKLPEALKDFIREHHGRGVAKYFYNTAVNNDGIENVDISRFQYPGPNPQSKETAILMMADAVEAASRSLKDYSVESITNLVNKIIDGQMADGLFKEAPISFKDIDVIKKTFINRLGTIYHTRVAYPELKKRMQEE